MSVASTTASAGPRVPSRRGRGGRALVHVVLIVLSLIWLVPMYLLLINAFKPEDAILGNPFGIPWDRLTPQYLWNAIVSPDFNVVGAYGTTLLLVVLVVAAVILVCGPVSYVIARRLVRGSSALWFYFLLGMFIPGQVTVIPAVTILRAVGLMNTLPGLVAFQVCTCIPVTLFLYVAYIRTISPSLDEAAALDGAGRMTTYWRIVFPLMRPVVITNVVLNAVGIWNDFVHPQIILGPLTGIKTVTTGIYAALGQYNSFFTVVYPNLLLVLAPALLFFMIMQRRIVGGLTSGAIK